jgi:hypothetical protein
MRFTETGLQHGRLLARGDHDRMALNPRVPR